MPATDVEEHRYRPTCGRVTRQRGPVIEMPCQADGVRAPGPGTAWTCLAGPQRHRPTG
jgi:hypothetical protein